MSAAPSIREIARSLGLSHTTVSEALNCAVPFQKTMKEKSETVAPDKRVQFRIGLNLGDVMRTSAIH